MSLSTRSFASTATVNIGMRRFSVKSQYVHPVDSLSCVSKATEYALHKLRRRESKRSHGSHSKPCGLQRWSVCLHNLLRELNVGVLITPDFYLFDSACLDGIDLSRTIKASMFRWIPVRLTIVLLYRVLFCVHSAHSHVLRYGNSSLHCGCSNHHRRG